MKHDIVPASHERHIFVLEYTRREACLGMSPYVSQPWQRALRSVLQNESIFISGSHFLILLGCEPVFWGFLPYLIFLFVWNSERTAQTFLKSAIMAFVPGKCMAFLVCLWQLHKEVSHALSCQELLTSLEEYQSEGYRASLPESLSHSALPQTAWFQSSMERLQPASPHLMHMESRGVKVWTQANNTKQRALDDKTTSQEAIFLNGHHAFGK